MANKMVPVPSATLKCVSNTKNMGYLKMGVRKEEIAHFTTQIFTAQTLLTTLHAMLHHVTEHITITAQGYPRAGDNPSDSQKTDTVPPIVRGEDSKATPTMQENPPTTKTYGPRGSAK
ncbi:MAG: hypothetical protein AAFO96_28535 [Bacteroidota bacterium]